MRVALIDYGAGNPASVLKAFAAAGADVVNARAPEDLRSAGALVIPGVGHFQATSALGPVWRDAIRTRIASGAAVLGICLGLQWLFDGSDGAADIAGLGVFPGRCFRLRGAVKVPHVGWNTLRPSDTPSRFLDGITPDTSVYFTHTFAAPVVDSTVATTTHGAEFTSVIERGRVLGTQFHPEKSGAVGLGMISNFIDIAREVC